MYNIIRICHIKDGLEYNLYDSLNHLVFWEFSSKYSGLAKAPRSINETGLYYSN